MEKERGGVRKTDILKKSESERWRKKGGGTEKSSGRQGSEGRGKLQKWEGGRER